MLRRALTRPVNEDFLRQVLELGQLQCRATDLRIQAGNVKADRIAAMQVDEPHNLRKQMLVHVATLLVLVKALMEVHRLRVDSLGEVADAVGAQLGRVCLLGSQ